MAGGTKSLAIGIAGGVAAATFGAAWQVATRFGVTAVLAPFDLAILRYGVPAIVLLPILVRRGLWPTPAPAWLALPIVLGAGLPFGLVAMMGAKFAPVAHMGALIPGTMPIFTAFMAAIFLGDRVSPRRLAGFAAILAGVAAIAGTSLSDIGAQTWVGDLLFLLAAAIWSVYTVAFRRSGLDPWQSIALISLSSILAAIPLRLAVEGTQLPEVPLDAALVQFAAQGVLAGLAGTWTFSLAVRHIGAARAALSGAFVPVLATLGGAAALGEIPTPAVLAGMALTIVGTLLAAWPSRG
ncbi:MAG: EamA family transporter [Alphaproteobacteria bacterium]|nr:EamA family transporter [Alphaproteobacteria bacterium]